MTKLSKNQEAALRELIAYDGQSVDVLTSGYTANVNPEFVQSAVGIFSSAALRGLAAKGFITIKSSFWKGAIVQVHMAEAMEATQ